MKSLFKGALRSLGFEIVSRRNYDRMVKADRLRGSDVYRLDSGERQTAGTLEAIRRDHRVRYDLVVHEAKQHFEDTSVLSAADVFCGNGYGSHLVAEALRCCVVGIDASREATDFANAHYGAQRTLFSCKEFPFSLPPSVYDIVVCYESIEHVDDYGGLMRMLTNALKPGGLFFLSTPNEDVLPLSMSGNKFHKRHFRFNEIKHLFEETLGLSLVRWLGQETYAFDGGAITGLLPEDKMDLKDQTAGSTLVYVFHRA